jgi:teichuronic acid biosynthesis glycosyltransferase TuaC
MTDTLWMTPQYPWEEEPVAGVFYQTQAQALTRLGVSVTVLNATPWAPWPLSSLQGRWGRYARAPRLSSDGRVRVARPRYLNVPGQPAWALPDRQLAMAAWNARREWTGAKLIHGHSLVEGLAAWRLSRRTGLPLVLTFHGSDMNTWPDDHPGRLPDLRAAVRHAGIVIAVSGALADRVRALTGVAATHLPLGSDHRSLASSTLPRQEARRVLGIPGDRTMVLFVGNLLPAKGIRELADAIRQLGPPFLGVFIGGGPEAGYGLTHNGADAPIEYKGERTHDEVIRYMSAADVIVLPSYREGLPTVLVEAGSIGLPVIATAVGGIPELLGRDRGALIPSPSAPAIRTALEAFVADRNGAEAAARRLREHVVANYDVDVNAARLAEAYRSLCPDLVLS